MSDVQVINLSNPEGVPDNAQYFAPGEEPPSGWTIYEGPDGATYALDPALASEEEQETQQDVPGEEEAEDASDDAEEVPGGDETNGPWTPFIGSTGHEGWVSPDGEIVNTRRPPGELIDSVEEIPEAARERITSEAFYDEIDEDIAQGIEEEANSEEYEDQEPAFTTLDPEEEWMSINEVEQVGVELSEGDIVRYKGEQFEIQEITEHQGREVWVGENPDGQERMVPADNPRTRVPFEEEELPDYPELDAEWIPSTDEHGFSWGWENVETGEFEEGTTPPGDYVRDVEDIPDEFVQEMADRETGFTTSDDIRDNIRERIDQLERYEQYGETTTDSVESTHLDLETDIEDYDPDVESLEPGESIVTEHNGTTVVDSITDDGRVMGQQLDGKQTEVNPVATVKDVELNEDTTSEEVAKRFKTRVPNVDNLPKKGFREEHMEDPVRDEVEQSLNEGVNGSAIFEGMEQATELGRLQISNYMDSEVAQLEFDVGATDRTLSMFAQEDELEGELVKIGKVFQEENPELEGFADEEFTVESTTRLGDDQEFEESWSNVIDSWSFNNESETTAPMWKMATEMFGLDEDAVPDRVQDTGFPVDVEDEAMENMKEYVEYQQDVLRDVFGDEIKVYRGISGDYPQQMKEDIEDGESAEIDHRAVESWSVSPTQASGFGEVRDPENKEGVLIETSVPVENVILSSLDNIGLESELEITAFGGEDGETVQEYEDGGGDIGDGEGVHFTTEVGSEGDDGKVTTHSEAAEVTADIYRKLSD